MMICSLNLMFNVYDLDSPTPQWQHRSASVASDGDGEDGDGEDDYAVCDLDSPHSSVAA